MTKDVLVTVKGLQSIEAGEPGRSRNDIQRRLLLQERTSLYFL